MGILFDRTTVHGTRQKLNGARSRQEDNSIIMDVSSNTIEDLEQILGSLEKERDDNEVDILSVEYKVKEDSLFFETDRINSLERKVVSTDSRIMSIEKQNIDLMPRLEKVGKCAQMKDKELNDLRIQFEEKTSVEKTEERFCKLEEFHSDITEKFINLLGVCEGFQSELEELMENNNDLNKPSKENAPTNCSVSLQGSQPAAASLCITRFSDIPSVLSTNTSQTSSKNGAEVSRSMGKRRRSDKQQTVSVSQRELSSNVVELFKSQNSSPSLSGILNIKSSSSGLINLQFNSPPPNCVSKIKSPASNGNPNLQTTPPNGTPDLHSVRLSPSGTPDLRTVPSCTCGIRNLQSGPPFPRGIPNFLSPPPNGNLNLHSVLPPPRGPANSQPVPLRGGIRNIKSSHPSGIRNLSLPPPPSGIRNLSVPPPIRIPNLQSPTPSGVPKMQSFSPPSSGVPYIQSISPPPSDFPKTPSTAPLSGVPNLKSISPPSGISSLQSFPPSSKPLLQSVPSTILLSPPPSGFLNLDKSTEIPNKFSDPSLFPMGSATECSRYNWKFPVDQQVVFGPIPATADHNVTYQFLRSAFHFIGQVCNMFLSQTIERNLVTGDLVKFGYVVFVDKVSTQEALKVGKVVMPDGFQVLLKEVHKPWLTS